MSRREAHASVLFQRLRRVGVTHIVGLPDNASARLLDLAHDDATIQFISVTREGEAFAIAAGLWIGGAVPVVSVQNTGLLESGDGLRGTASRIGVPLLTLVTCRGWSKREASNIPRTEPLTRDTLVRADLDSVAFMTEPTLAAWGIPFGHYGSDDDEAGLDAMWHVALTQERPVALLITSDLL